ncbi:MAG: folate family ECF transporter S component [Clostridia bacterium]|nr:folate family ECF transporter S component [Clostridia bacterium]
MENLLASVTAFDFAKIFGNLQKRWYYYLALFVVIAIIVVVTLLQKNRRNNLSPTQKIVYTAVMSALCFLANYYTIKVSDVLQISLVATVGFLSGYMLGSGLGFASAFIGDLICGIVAPFGAYNPIIGIGTGLWGFIPGVLFNNLRINQIITAIISFILCFIFNSFLVNTLGLSLMYSMTFESLLVLLPTKLLVVAINAVISILLMLTLRKILPKHKFHLY